MTDTIDKVAFAAAELLAASDALASAAAEVDALRAEVARQTGIAVDYCARADAAEQMVAECCALLADVKNAEWMSRREGLTPSPFWGDEWQSRIDAALSRTEAVAGRWVSVGVAAGIAKRCDAAIARAEKAEAERDEAEEELGYATEKTTQLLAAERARDEVGIQLAAAQAEIARLRRVVDETRTLMATPACERLPAERAVCDALRALDAVPGDALAPRITAALEASGIDSAVVQWEKRAEKAWSERDAALSTMLTLRSEVARLTAEVEAMRAVVEEADRVYTTCEPNAPMLVQHLGECLDALRARKVGG